MIEGIIVILGLFITFAPVCIYFNYLLTHVSKKTDFDYHLEIVKDKKGKVKLVDDEYLLPHIYPVFDSIIYFVNLIAYTIMFNTIFRKNKVLKTILFNIAMSFAFVILTAVVVNVTTPEFWEDMFEGLVEWLDEKTDVELFGYLMTTVRCLTILMSTVFLSITYFRIKKVNY